MCRQHEIVAIKVFFVKLIFAKLTKNEKAKKKKTSWRYWICGTDCLITQKMCVCYQSEIEMNWFDELLKRRVFSSSFGFEIENRFFFVFEYKILLIYSLKSFFYIFLTYVKIWISNVDSIRYWTGIYLPMLINFMWPGMNKYFRSLYCFYTSMVVLILLSALFLNLTSFSTL